MSKVTLFILLVTLALASLEKPAEEKSDTSTKMTSKSNEDAGSGSDDEAQKTENVDLMMIMATCNETFRIETSYLEAMHSSGSFPDETDRNPKCFLRCVLVNAGVSSEDGEIDPAKAVQVLYGNMTKQIQDDFKEVAVACSDRKESCKCEKAYQFMKCAMEMEISKKEKMADQKSKKQ